MSGFDFSKAEFFKKDSIIPQRILKGPRKFKHLMLFGSDTYAISSAKGYVMACDTAAGGSCIRMLHCRHQKGINANFKGSPYHIKGGSCWVGNEGPSGNEGQLKILNNLMGVL